MNQLTRNSIMIAAAWTGPLFVICYLYFFVILGHFLPPPLFQSMSAEAFVSSHYLAFQSDIKLGMTGSTFVGLLYMGWSCCLAAMMGEHEGKSSMFSNLELAGGLLTGWLLAFCPAIWLGCAVFANTVDAGAIQLVHGFTWYIFDMTYMITTLQLLGLGLYTIFNTEQKAFPVWSGWAAIAVGVIFLPLSLVAYMPTGPFSVGGSWNFYIVFGAWGFLFFSVYSYYMLKELYRQRSELQAAGGTVPQTA